MNKLGIKVYGEDIFEIDSVSYMVNSINTDKRIIYNSAKYNYHNYRIIKSKLFGIMIIIKNK